DFTLNVPRYRVTHRRKVVNGRCCISCANTSLPRFIDAPTELCFAGWQSRYSRFKSRPSEFADYAFLINNLRKPRSKTLGHYWIWVTLQRRNFRVHSRSSVSSAHGQSSSLTRPKRVFWILA